MTIFCCLVRIRTRALHEIESIKDTVHMLDSVELKFISLNKERAIQYYKSIKMGLHSHEDKSYSVVSKYVVLTHFDTVVNEGLVNEPCIFQEHNSPEHATIPGPQPLPPTENMDVFCCVLTCRSKIAEELKHPSELEDVEFISSSEEKANDHFAAMPYFENEWWTYGDKYLILVPLDKEISILKGGIVIAHGRRSD